MTGIEEIVERLRQSGGDYLEFLRVPSMSVGVYLLRRGARDPQTPHREDEIYYVVRGRARFLNGAEEREVGPGETLSVPARQEHRFHDVAEELVLLVVFAPAESLRV